MQPRTLSHEKINESQCGDECAENADAVSKTLFEALVAEEEVHQDQYETELDNLEKFGANYLALQSVERSKSVATGTAPKGE